MLLCAVLKTPWMRQTLVAGNTAQREAAGIHRLCLPETERHPGHGQTVNADWSILRDGRALHWPSFGHSRVARPDKRDAELSHTDSGGASKLPANELMFSRKPKAWRNSAGPAEKKRHTVECL